MSAAVLTNQSPAIGAQEIAGATAPATIRVPLAAATTGRNEAIDVVRLFAAAGIVFCHAGESPAFDRWGNTFRFGVPFFLFASLYYQSLSLRRNPNRSLLQFIVGRLHRLYLPFLIWSAIYLVVRNVNRILVLHQGLVHPHLSMLWTGTEYHLWFLPLLLICSIVLAAVQRGLLRDNPRLRWPVIGIAIGIGLAVANGPMPVMPSVTESTFDSSSYAFLQWWLALPAACWAFAFAWLTTQGTVLYTVPQIAGVAGLLLVIGCSFRQAVHGIELAPRGLSGLGCMVAALSPWHGRTVSVLARYGRLGYGIYLCHVIPVEIIHVICHRLHLQASAYLDVLTFEIAFVTALAMASLLTRARRLAWLVG